MITSLAATLKDAPHDLDEPEVASPTSSGVLRLPGSMPFEMSVWLANAFGPPPWNTEQIGLGRAHYLESLTAEERERIDAIGYPDL